MRLGTANRTASVVPDLVRDPIQLDRCAERQPGMDPGSSPGWRGGISGL